MMMLVVLIIGFLLAVRVGCVWSWVLHLYIIIDQVSLPAKQVAANEDVEMQNAPDSEEEEEEEEGAEPSL
jgi:MFS superfamily sulfate permease-like transporter